MFRSKVKNRYRKGNNARFYQGDILKDLTFVVGDADRETVRNPVELEYSIILSQDCDIEQDFNSRKKIDENRDKHLRSFLICPAFKIEGFASGIHIEDWKMKTFGNKKRKKLKQNNEYKRYHYLPEYPEHLMPELILDFKHFFTLPRDLLYRKRRQVYLTSLSELFREELSQRFFNYLSRVGLPEWIENE